VHRCRGEQKTSQSVRLAPGLPAAEASRGAALALHPSGKEDALFQLIDAAYARGAPATGGGSPSPIASLLPFVLIMLVLYLLILRPQIKKQKAHQQMIDELEKGDEIITSGGIHGVIQNLRDDVIVLKVAENVKIEVSRAAVAQVKNKNRSTAGDRS